MGVPLDLDAGSTGVLSAKGLARAALDAVLPGHRSSATATSASATWSRSGSARRSSTGWSSRCSAGCTPVTRARSPPGPPSRSSWRCSTADRSLTRRRGRGHAARRRATHRSSPASGRRRPAARRARGAPPAVDGAHRTPRSATWRRRPERRLEPGRRLDPATPRCVQADAVVLATPRRADRPAAQRRRPGAALDAGAHRVRLDGHRHAGLPRPARSPTSPGSGFLVPRSTAAPIKASTFSFAEVGLGRARRARSRRTSSCCCAARSAGTARSRPCSAPTRSSSSWRWRDLADAIGLSVRAGRRARAAVGRRAAAVRRRHLDRVAADPGGVAGVPGSRSAARRTTASASRPASPRRGLAAAEVLGDLAALRSTWTHDGSQAPATQGRRPRDSTTPSATRCGRSSGSRDVLGEAPTARPRRARSRSCSTSSRPRTWSCGASTTSPACAPTPT